ncbi:MAG: pyruvoyl-dependent arginine decarboxylase [Candidatus Paceibacterota bacterium]|jgi:arginine decarboxylase
MSHLIKITSGTGSGSTRLSAFDAALFSAGIANYNLIKLSSIIPDDFEPVKEKIDLNGQEFGHRLYVVLSSCAESENGEEAWAGIGWVKSTGAPSRGLFVEHNGKSKEQVEKLIRSTLTDMVVYRPENFGEIDYEIVGIKCSGQPVSAIVAAVYQSEDWERK